MLLIQKGFRMQDNSLAAALVGHLVGDFLLQNDWMATNKKRSDYACVVHVLIYTATVMLLSGWYRQPASIAASAAALIALPHFAIDRTTFVQRYMDNTGRRNFRENLAPWSSVSIDQAMHALCLYWVWKLLTA